jgi:periplasmic protein TonB
MDLDRSPNFLFSGFILVSLLLHLLFLLLMPQRDLWQAPPPAEPVYVEVRPPRERELDVPPPVQETPRQSPARRLGTADQQVRKEVAPKGDAPEDRTPRPTPVPAPQPVPEPLRPAPEQVLPRTITPAPTRPGESGLPPAPVNPDSRPQLAPPAVVPAPPSQLPDLQALLRVPDATRERVVDESRQKYRAEVERGEAVWLDMEKDLLISFFQRFRNNIYGVWNYPRRAAERGEEGVLLLKITVNRKGELLDVQIAEGSPFILLDDEAEAAVRKAAPFGPLPRAYPQETLTIYAYFEYRLGSRGVIYGYR